MVRTLRDGLQYSVSTLLFAPLLLPMSSLARAHCGYAMVRLCQVGSSQLHTALALLGPCSFLVTAARPNGVHVYVHLPF